MFSFMHLNPDKRLVKSDYGTTEVFNKNVFSSVTLSSASADNREGKGLENVAATVIYCECIQLLVLRIVHLNPVCNFFYFKIMEKLH